MSNKKVSYSLYLVSDKKSCKNRDLEELIQQAILGGVTIVQLREKNIDSKDFYEQALRVKRVTDKYNIPLIINDRVDIALAVGADGVHVGQEDLSCSVIKRNISKNLIVGVSVHNVEEAMRAELDGADYIGCGAVFNTSTKENTKKLKIEELLKIKENVKIPVVAIGGINEENIEELYDSNIDGIAVVSAILSKDNCEEASRILKEKIKNL